MSNAFSIDLLKHSMVVISPVLIIENAVIQGRLLESCKEERERESPGDFSPKGGASKKFSSTVY